MMEEDHKSEKLKLKLKFTFKQQDQEKKQQQEEEEEVNELVEHPDHHASLEKKGDDGVEAAEVNTNNNGDEGESSSSALVVSKARFCHVCGREFINGKALGGHMRVHQQQEAQPRPRPVGSGPGPAQGDNQEQVHACTHCHKEFPSAKALFGHMRSHPERDYRGMQPPSGGSSRSPDGSGSDPGHGSGSGSGQSEPPWFPEGWSVTRKRGWTAVAESEARWARIKAYLYSNDDDSEEAAAAELVAFANGGDGGGGAAKRRRRLKKRGEYDEIDEYYLSNEVELSVESSLISYTPLPPPPHLDDPNKPLDDHVGSSSNSKSKSKSKAVALKSKNKKKSLLTNEGKKKANKMMNNKLMASIKADDGDNNKINHDDDDDGHGHGDGHGYDEGHEKYYGDGDGDDDDEEGEENEGVKKKWKCSTCNKTFPTHQALGGHRSSHNKDKQQTPHIKIPNLNYAPLTLTRTQVEPGSGLTHVGPGCDDKENGSGSGSGSSENLVFKCKTCGESFPTGQALGGHQRCHYTPPPSSESSPEEQTGSPAERRVLEIDLNLVAEEEEEEVDVGVENSTTR